MASDTVLAYKECKPIRTIVIYSADILNVNKELETKTEIARKALSEGATVEFVKKITGLDESTIKQLQEELENE